MSVAEAQLGWEAVLEGFASERSSQEFRLVVVGNSRTGKRTFASRIREALNELAAVTQGARIHSRHTGAGVEHQFVELRRGNRTPGSDSASASQVLEIVSVDSPGLVRSAFREDLVAAGRIAVVVVTDLSDPLRALEQLRRWRDAVNNATSHAADSGALSKLGNDRWAEGVARFRDANNSATLPSAGAGPPHVVLRQSLSLDATEVPFGIPSAIVATKIDLTAPFEKFDRQAAVVEPKARAVGVLVHWLRHFALATRAAFAVSNPHLSPVAAPDRALARYLLHLTRADAGSMETVVEAAGGDGAGALFPLGYDHPSELMKKVRSGLSPLDSVFVAEGSTESEEIIVPHQSVLEAVERQRRSTDPTKDEGDWTKEYE